MKKLIIAGGTGFIGQSIIDYYKNNVEEIVVLTRGKEFDKGNVKYVYWDAKNIGDWINELENTDVLINLVGKSVDCRYTQKNKTLILNSRVDSTHVLNQAINSCERPPKHFINSSTATIYRHSEDKQMTERAGEIGDDFSMNVAKNWENTFFNSETKQTIKTAIRTSIVLGKNGGALTPLKRLTKLGLGGKQGNGEQFVSWIHEDDLVAAIHFIITHKLEGPINVTAPNPIKNNVFMKLLRNELNIPFGINSPVFILKIGAALIGTETELVLKSRNVIPEILQENGFQFKFNTVDVALKDILKS